MRVTEDLSPLPASAVYPAHLIAEKGSVGSGALRIWIEGRELIGKDVLEIGCGCGWLGKRLGLICRSYLGIDYSELALAIARGVSLSNCVYLHVSERENLAARAGSMDVMVGREFFIHQNYANALWVLALGRHCLRARGLISADFYLGNPDVPQGVIHSARAPLDPNYPSCAFQFTSSEIKQIAAETGLTILDMVDWLDHQRRFVLFRTP